MSGPKGEACPRRDLDPRSELHAITKQTMQKLRNNPAQAWSFRQAARQEWRDVFARDKKRSLEEIDYLVSQKDCAALEGAIFHIGLSAVIKEDILPRLQSGRKLSEGMHKWFDTYYKYQDFGYESFEHDNFMRAMVHWQRTAIQHFLNPAESKTSPHPYFYLWTTFEEAAATRVHDKKIWDESRFGRSSSKQTNSHAKFALHAIADETTHEIMELLLDRKLAHKDPNVDSEKLTKIALADIPILSLVSHITGPKAVKIVMPWTIAFFSNDPTYDPISEFKKNPILIEESGDLSLPTCSFRHASLKDGEAKVEGACAGRFPLISPDKTDRKSVKELLDYLKDYLGEEGRERIADIGDSEGGFDSATMAFVIGAFIARDNLFLKGISPVRMNGIRRSKDRLGKPRVTLLSDQIIFHNQRALDL